MPNLTLIPVLLLLGIATRSQPFPELRFAQLTERDGLSSDKTTFVTQDSAGIIWVSTGNGLNRFDGFGFTRFFADPNDSSTILANEIESIQADRHNNLWVQTAGGICRFNTATYRVDRFDSGRSTPPPFRSYDNASIWLNNDGDVYVVSSNGLFHFTDTRYTEVDEAFPPFVTQQILITHYRGLVRDHRGNLWAYNSKRICRVDPVTFRVLSSTNFDEDIDITGLVFDSANRCWVSTWHHGILELGPEGIIGRGPKDFAGEVIYDGLEWQYNGHHYLVYTTNKPGLLLVDPATGNSRYYLTDRKIDGMGPPFVDRQNTLWIPTSAGLFYLDASASIYDVIPIMAHGEDFPDGRYFTTPYNMREEKSGFWIARRYLGGMLWYTRDWRLIRDWAKVVDSIGPQFHEGPATLKEAYDFKQVGDTMYITTEWGVMLLDLRTQRRSMIVYPGGPDVLRLRTIVPETDRRWWVRSFSHGIYVFDPKACRFLRHYRLVAGNCDSCGPPSANYLLRNHKGRIFATTNAGLFRYDPRTDSFLTVRMADNRSPGNSLFGLAEDRSGLIWIGQDNGICAYNPDSNRIVRVMSEGNSIGPVERIAVDSTQNVWFRSITGYWCWLRRQDRLIQFRINNGQSDNDEGLFYTASNGNVYAGCERGIVWFHADRLGRYSANANVRILDAFANDRRLPITYRPGGEKTLVLRPGQHNLQVIFDVINYNMPENNLFYYKLSTTPGDWTPVLNGRLSFNNLAPGDYTLTVKGGNKLAGMLDSTDTLVFTILPYWYQSIWFKTLVGLALLMLILLAVRRRIAHIRREAAFRLKITDTELQALRAQMNPHFVFNSLNSIENFIMKNEKWLASDYLNKFARLFRMILQSSRNELVPFTKDMDALQLYVDLERLRFNNRFAYETEIDPQLTEGEYRVPSLLIQPYVENAIIHRLGLSSREDKIVRVAATLHGEYICYRITDNGVGRVRAREVRRVNNPNHNSVGLAITENRINIFSHQQNSAGRVSITDLSNKDGTAAGTLVEVIIKAI
jgi:ligand-binding sensor domain-containing protein/anti-sigma regulatory factor (Ser/Thr protein kinase)